MGRLLTRNKGITLIELLVALVITGTLVGAVYRTFIGQQKTYTVQEQVVDMQQNVRAAINRMMTDIRMAGFGNVSMVLPDMNTNAWRGKNNWDVVNPNYPVASSVTILSGMGSTTLTAVPASNQITVNSLTDSQGNTLFDTVDRKYISIAGVESYAITNIAGNTLTLSGTLTFSHAVGTPVFAIRAVTYQVNGLTLLRDENMGAGGQPMADNIENLQFVYFGADGITPTGNPPDIRNIQVRLRAKTSLSDPEYKTDGGYRKREITSNVHLRNMGLEL